MDDRTLKKANELKKKIRALELFLDNSTNNRSALTISILKKVPFIPFWANRNKYIYASNVWYKDLYKLDPRVRDC